MLFLNSLFDGFFRLGKQSHDEIDFAQSALHDLDIQVAITTHENWKNRLRAYLDGTSKEVLTPMSFVLMTAAIWANGFTLLVQPKWVNTPDSPR
jgi:hypothetical protein